MLTSRIHSSALNDHRHVRDDKVERELQRCLIVGGIQHTGEPVSLRAIIIPIRADFAVDGTLLAWSGTAMQHFTARAVIAIKLSALGVMIVGVTGLLAWRAVIAPRPAIGAPVEQPIPFSHKHHAGDDGIDCRYCHTSVETSSFAGIPPLSTCMTCHSQLFTDAPALQPLRDSVAGQSTLSWQRVHDLPDFVYFDHSIHLAKGVGCSTCHGQVDAMPLTWRVASLRMQWCLDCHREPERHLRPRSEVFDMQWNPPSNQLAVGKQLRSTYHLHSTATLTACSTCHR